MIESVKMNTSELLSIVRKNREKHFAEYNEAVADYVVACNTIAKQNMKTVRQMNSDNYSVIAPKVKHLPPSPKSYIEDYDKAIRMLELSVDEVIEIQDHSFSTLVLDNWSWKQAFVASNNTYKSFVG